MSYPLFGILSPRNVTLFVFILVVLFLGATFNVHVGPESFVEGKLKKSKTTNPYLPTSRSTSLTPSPTTNKPPPLPPTNPNKPQN
jgi:hypothetical protein